MTAKRDIKIDYTSLCTNIIRVILQFLPISGCRMAMTYDFQISPTVSNEFSAKQTAFQGDNFTAAFSYLHVLPPIPIIIIRKR